MNILEAIRNRQSVRAFLDKPVESEFIKRILETARWAPSGVNTQPWQVVVAGQASLRRIGDAITEALNSDQKPNPDYQYYPKQFPPPYKTRRVQCGMALYGALGIARDDMEKREAQWHKNYYGFGAPVELFVFIDDFLEKGSWLDTGMFIQNIMLAARGMGLETCPQAAMAEFPDIIRSILEVPDNRHLICGIALGYADWSHPVNQYRTEREEIDAFTKWID